MTFNTFKLIPLLLLFALFSFITSANAQKMKAEEIVLKHLDSIGSKENREKIKNLMAVGKSEFNVVRSATYNFGQGSGSAVFLSEAEKLYYGMKFNAINYPFDELIFDGTSTNAGFIKPGQHSALGYYLINNRYIVNEGLFGGTLSTAWSLFDWQSQGAKLENDGKKKVNGRNAYVVKYLIKGGSQSVIKLYFDEENFQHVRTEYRRVIPAPFSRNPLESSFQVETVHQLTENFSNYKKVNNVAMPHSYKINLLLNGKVTDEIEWNFEFSDFRFNQKIDPGSFNAK
ncbi:MAG: hypothetical protein JWN60_1004 [Acidobacteria bacterium]|nr:hypothetical protein [Acidobacteriota bacterium]